MKHRKSRGWNSSSRPGSWQLVVHLRFRSLGRAHLQRRCFSGCRQDMSFSEVKDRAGSDAPLF